MIAITGVSKGLGKALTEEFIKQGQTVFGCARSERAIAALSQKYEKSDFAVVDVTNASEVAIWAEQIVRNYGSPTILINNAGVCNSPGSLWKVDEEDFRQVLDVNVTGTFATIKAFLPHMISTGSGLVINMSSGWGRSVDANVAPYCASKWAIEGLTKAMALEVPSGVAAVALNPGIIDTAMLQSVFGEENGQISATDWAEKAAKYILGISTDQNGASLTVGEE